MFKVNVNQYPQMIFEAQPISELDKLLAKLSPEVPWGERKLVAQQLGCLRDPEAIPWLLHVLPDDPFWMVRCAIIQALVMIGDPEVIPALRILAERDVFQVVRSHAAKAVERLS